ncbi:RagB/SusD family nutrient uptake outer membrane protein [Sphingobacterium tabacisoli]|uniref:RagB/SusD family nutrient uptake outer membrane protein n=1 Tax=Sphingobacterium tabacisoli TaxID=2044855 RepID=A0ABW5L7F4_9SPHI|nr:RagB/SusD family nutrient uptake outer membrane protein [Sphingobacterium tabacisoli]
MKTIKANLFLVSIGILVGFLSSCNNFLEVKPKGIIIPDKIEDYEGMLFSQQMTLAFPPELLYTTDDFFDLYDEYNRSSQANSYYWRPGLDPNELEPPVIWGPYYTLIYHCNVIISQVPNTTNGSDSQKQQLVAEAKVNRASAYFHLLTAFAKAYDPQTAASLPGVPLVNSTNVTDAIPQRATLQEVVDLILNDTESSIEHLPKVNKNGYRVTQKGALGLLTRVHLYLGNYEKSLSFADRTLANPHTLMDYNDYNDVYELPEEEVGPECVWMQGSSDYSVPLFMLYSDDLKSYYNSDDLRYFLFSETNNNGIFYVSPAGRSNLGISYPEIYLSKAEALARGGKVAEALEIVNNLRKKRILKAAYVPLSANDKEAALKVVLAERRRELAFKGPRWMDMKRLDRENRMPTVQRIDPANGKVMATLAPGSKQYTFQIPARVQQFNRGITLNEE